MEQADLIQVLGRRMLQFHKRHIGCTHSDGPYGLMPRLTHWEKAVEVLPE